MLNCFFVVIFLPLSCVGVFASFLGLEKNESLIYFDGIVQKYGFGSEIDFAVGANDFAV